MTAAGSSPSGSSSSRHGSDVLVVGAGIAGLAAAWGLSRRGLSIRLVEARQRVGGRLLTKGGLDLGATWFWANEPRIQRLVAELGLETHAQFLDGDGLYHSPEGAARLDGNPIDAPAGRFSPGAGAVAEALVQKLPAASVHLGCPVSEIRLVSGGIEAHSGGEVFTASQLVLAVPPALAAARLSFSPGLPEELARLAAKTPVWMGAITKVVARYPEPFWRREGLAGSAISHIGPMREIHDMSGPLGKPAALFGFAPSGPRELSREAVLRQFAGLFGARAANPEELFLQDWRAEVFTSPPGVEALNVYELFGHPLYRQPALDCRMHWATTETSPEYPGHVEGALVAAERAVSAILEGGDPS